MMKLGFGKRNMTPPVGTELAGYAGYRPCAGVHDPLWCKAVVLEQDGIRYALVALDLMCVDEPLYHRIGDALETLAISRQNLVVCAIHSHAAPQGVLPGEGPLAAVNAPTGDHDPALRAYIATVIRAAKDACAQAVEELEAFRVRSARGPLPALGSERHTGAPAAGELVVIQCQTRSGRLLTLYNFPCHPTVLSAGNLQVSADCIAGIEERLGGDMAVFLNGAAGDISTRFTRRESSFAECARLSAVAAEAILALIKNAEYAEPEPLRGRNRTVTLRARETESPETAQKMLSEAEARWREAVARNEDPGRVRILKSYVEGAGVNLEFSRTMGHIRELHLPVTAFRVCGLDVVCVPGELFSGLRPKNAAVICYANGYFRYICPEEAYDAGYYEAMAAIIARGEGERLSRELDALLREI